MTASRWLTAALICRTAESLGIDAAPHVRSLVHRAADLCVDRACKRFARDLTDEDACRLLAEARGQ